MKEELFAGFEKIIKRQTGLRVKIILNPIDIEDILEVVSSNTDVTVADIIGPSRRSSIAEARQISCYLSRIYTEYSLLEIGQRIGGRDHSSVFHSINVVKGFLDIQDEKITHLISKLKLILYERAIPIGATV
jgi:chromosomal replication initiator protein